MHKRWFVAVVVVVGVGLWWVFGPGSSRSKPQSVALATRGPNAPDPRASFLAKRAPIDDKMLAPPEVSKECLEYWETLRGIDTGKTFREGQYQNVPLSNGACATVPAKLQDSHDKFQQYCGAFLKMSEKNSPPREFDLSKKGCSITMGVYRAQITEWLTRDTPLSEINDPRVLADKTMARYMEDPQKAAEAAERMLEVEPTSYPAAKVSLMARMVDARKGGKPIDDATYEKVKERLAVARELGGDDKNHLNEMEFGLEAGHSSDPVKMRATADKFVKEDPKSGLGYYLQACAARKAGNTAEALILMAKAIKAEPNEFRYRQSLELMHAEKGDLHYGVCGMQLELPAEFFVSGT